MHQFVKLKKTEPIHFWNAVSRYQRGNYYNEHPSSKGKRKRFFHAVLIARCPTLREWCIDGSIKLITDSA